MGEDSDVVRMFKQISNDVTAIRVQNQQISAQVSEIKQELINYKLEVKGELEVLKETIKHITEEYTELKKRAENIERKLKKNNLIIYGLKENQQEDILEKVGDLFRTKLSVEINTDVIRDSYRIGNFDDTKTRAILVEFLNNKTKSEVLLNAFRLKGSGIAISPDLTQTDYLRRKFLLSQVKIEKANGHTAKIKGKCLILDDVSYSYEDLIKKQQQQSITTQQTEETRRGKDEARQETNTKIVKNLRSNSKSK